MLYTQDKFSLVYLATLLQCLILYSVYYVETWVYFMSSVTAKYFVMCQVACEMLGLTESLSDVC